MSPVGSEHPQTVTNTQGRQLFQELLQHRDLLFMLTLRDIKIRYKQSVMGFLWAVLLPILVVSSGLIVMVAFSTISGRSIDKLAVLSVAVKSVPWAFFVGAVRFATNSLVMNKELVTKVYFPREVLPLAAVLASAVDFAVALAVLVIVLCIANIGVSVYLLWVPLLLALLVLITVAFALLLACANVFFRDVKYLVEIGLTYGVFFTPVFYSASSLGKFGKVILLNPISPILEAFYATVILHQGPDIGWLCNSVIWSSLGLMMIWKLFARSESSFAESV
jgi:lipopolysaccharide transport system permease protein